MENAVIIIILAAVVFFAGRYLYKAKKRGDKCIGCQYGKTCGGKCGGSTDTGNKTK